MLVRMAQIHAVEIVALGGVPCTGLQSINGGRDRLYLARAAYGSPWEQRVAPQSAPTMRSA